MNPHLVYISGPMRNMPGLNFPSFAIVETYLKDRGFEVINPANLGTYLEKDHDPDWYIDRDLDIILTRKPGLMVALPGHGSSEGAMLEIEEQQRLDGDLIYIGWAELRPVDELDMSELANRIDAYLERHPLPLTTEVINPEDWGPPEDNETFTPESLLQLHTDLCDKAREIMKSKNHDYRGGTGDPFSNFRDSVGLGVHPVIGIMLRMRDKQKRIKTFVEKGELKVQGEGVLDAILDQINYLVLQYGMIKEAER